MDEAMLFKFGKWVEKGRKILQERRVVWVTTILKILNPPSIFLEWMKLHSLNLANALTTASPTPWEKIPLKQVWSGSRDQFLNFKPPPP